MDANAPTNHGPLDGAAQRGTTLAAFVRSDGTELRVVADEFNGTRFLTVRVWWLAPEGEMRPTKKGITVRSTELDDFAAAVAQGRRLLAAVADSN